MHDQLVAVARFQGRRDAVVVLDQTAETVVVAHVGEPALQHLVG